MKHLIVTSLIFTFSAFSVFSQVEEPPHMRIHYYKYQKVTEYYFDKETQKFTLTDTLNISGEITIDYKKVHIQRSDYRDEKKIKVIEIKEEEGTNKDLYICELYGEKFTIEIPPENNQLTMTGTRYKYVYELKTIGKPDRSY